MNRAASYSLACLLALVATAAQAVPVSFTFSTELISGSDRHPPGTQVRGAFTIETDVETFPAEDFENDQVIPLGLFYWNPVLRYDQDVGGDHYSFVSTRPTLDDGIQESTFAAFDLLEPRTNPTMSYDLFQLDQDFGTGHFAPPNDGLKVFASLIHTQFDLDVIQSTDMLLGLTTAPSWDFFFTIFDPETGEGPQVHAIVTNLRQVVEAPEPGTAGLFIAGLGMLGLAVRRRRQAPAASFITRCGVAIA
jgi:hypothetical protein